MDRYVILQDVDGSFAVRIDDGSDRARLSPTARAHTCADCFVVGMGRAKLTIPVSEFPEAPYSPQDTAE